MLEHQETGLAPQRRNYRDEVLELSQSDARDVAEVIMRIFLVSAAGFSLLWATGMIIMVIWSTTYSLLLAGYIALLRRQWNDVSLIQYVALFGYNILLQVVFAAMCVYVFTFGSPSYWFIAGCGVCGLGLHNIVRHTFSFRMAVGDIVVITCTIIASLTYFTTQTTSIGGTVALIVVGLSLCIYYVQSFMTTYAMRADLSESLAKEVQAQKMQSVGQLTSGIAHDFNNILTVIRGNLDLIEALDDPTEKRAALDEARNSSEKAAHLVSQLLAFSRKSRIQPRHLHLRTTLHEFVDLACRVLPANIQIDLRPVPDHFSVYADNTLLQSALLNIAVNARDAMGQEGGSFYIRAMTLPEKKGPPRFVQLLMVDTGPGAPVDLLPRLSEPFFSSKPVGEGSGLGLSMVQGFAEQSGGTLRIDNAPDAGLRVRLTLPINPIPSGQPK